VLGINIVIVECDPPTEPLTSKKAERGTSPAPSTADKVTVAAEPISTVV
jgi:hypothetical protein